LARKEFLGGIASGIVACVSWSFVFPLGRYLNNIGVDPFFQAFGRFAIAALVLCAIVVARERETAARALRDDWKSILFLGTVGIFGMGSLVFLSLRYTTSIKGGILMNANPVVVVLIAPFFGERLTLRKFAAVLLGVVGCGLVISGRAPRCAAHPTNDLLGCALAMSAAVCWAVYTVAGKRVVRTYGGLTTTAMAMAVGALILLVIVVAARIRLPRGILPMGVICFIGLVPTALGFFLWYHALVTVQAGILAPLQFITPVGTVLLGTLFLGEPFLLITLCGMLLIFVAIGLSVFSTEASGGVRGG